MKKVVINSDGYYPQCPTCGHFDLDEKIDAVKCHVCGEELDRSHLACR